VDGKAAGAETLVKQQQAHKYAAHFHFSPNFVMQNSGAPAESAANGVGRSPVAPKLRSLGKLRMG
jgi:hypothetical protein